MNDKPPPDKSSSRRSRSVARILDAAARLFGTEGFQGASMHAVARAAGVSKGLLHYHFRSKEHLLIEAQRATFRQIYARFEERVRLGEGGLPTALDALDAMWEAIREMRTWAPFMVETLSLAQPGHPVREDLDAFYLEALTLLQDGIEEVFHHQLDELTVPPQRMARLIRLALHGLVIELAFAQSDEDLAVVDQMYLDIRLVGERLMLSPERHR